MAKQIIFSYEGKDYTLEYTRRTIQGLQRLLAVITSLMVAVLIPQRTSSSCFPDVSYSWVMK